jgi:hypothetical protein
VHRCLLIVVAPLGLMVCQAGKRLTPAEWAVLSMALAVLAVLALVGMGRAAFGTVQAKTSRYSELGMALVPLSALAWGFALRRWKALKAVCLAALWLFFFTTFLDNWRFKEYAYYNGVRRAGVSCVRDYYLKGGDAACAELFPASLATRLDAARDLNVSFYRELNLPARVEGK